MKKKKKRKKQVCSGYICGVELQFLDIKTCESRFFCTQFLQFRSETKMDKVVRFKKTI